MTLNIKKVFSKSSSSKGGRSKETYTKLESPSMTTIGQDEASSAQKQTTDDIAEMKRKALEEKRARQAEEYLARHGFVSPSPSLR